MSNFFLPEPSPPVRSFRRDPLYANPPEAVRNLDRNERLEPLPDVIVEAVRQALSSDLITQYPNQAEVRARLSAYLGVGEENLILTPGSDAAIRSAFHAYIVPGDKVLSLKPSYGMYGPYAELFGGKPVTVSYDKNLSYDFEEFLDCIVPGVKFIAVANPNQPIGTMIDRAGIKRILEKAAAVGSLVMIDEAYHPFSGMTVVDMVAEYPHLLVLRTFSKGLGMAGLRIGYAVGHPEVVGNMFKVRSAHDVNAVALLCADEVLKRPELIDRHVENIMAGGRILIRNMRRLGFEPIEPILTNFLLIRVGHVCKPEELSGALLASGYRIKGPFGHPSLEGMLRVTLGPPGLMEEFSALVEEKMRALGGRSGAS